MALTIIGSLSIAEATRHDIHAMLIGAVGCNTAWGLVDAIMYLLTLVVERRRGLALLLSIRKDPDAARARRPIAERLPPLVSRSVREPELEHVRQALVSMEDLPGAGLTGKDFLAALAVFALVFLSTVPVALPFLLAVDATLAVRMSNGVALAILFAVGFRRGRYMGYRPILVGLASVAVGVALVALTIALGG